MEAGPYISCIGITSNLTAHFNINTKAKYLGWVETVVQC